MRHGDKLLPTQSQVGTKLKCVTHLEADRILLLNVLHIEPVLPLAGRKL